ncbi:MAG: hypothetical protein MZW92_74850 [Comamonadaceae bacterium]|nr:hypothetical protein [Comamonadaceae bacterium]
MASALFFGDVYRAAPFDPASTLPDAGAPLPWTGTAGAAPRPEAVPGRIAPLLERHVRRVKAVPLLERVLSRRQHQIGSNEWAVSARADGRRPAAGRQRPAPRRSASRPTCTTDAPARRSTGSTSIGSSFRRRAVGRARPEPER